MLALTRRTGESIIIETSSGDLIEVIVSERGYNDRKGQIRLAIDAPDNVFIVRSELYGKMKNKRGGKNEQVN